MNAAHKLLIGTAGWSYKDWEGIVYPLDLKHRRIHPLEYLARFFDTTEINSSFYGPIRPEIARLWCRRAGEVNPGFVFTAKLYRVFTHSPLAVSEPTSAATIRSTAEDEVRTREGLDSIASEGRLGALLIQFPVSFKNTSLNREYLDRLLRQFIEYPRVVELRHSSWNEPGILDELSRQRVSFCNIDQPMLGRSLGPTEYATAPVAYVRLHGRNYEHWFDSDSRNDRYDYLYTEPELAAWKDRIEHVAKNSATTFVIANNHFEGKAAANALQLKAMLLGRRVMAPPTLLEKYVGLKKFADPKLGESGPQLPLKHGTG